MASFSTGSVRLFPNCNLGVKTPPSQGCREGHASGMCEAPSTLPDTPVGHTILVTVVMTVSALDTDAGAPRQHMDGFVSWPWYLPDPGEQGFHLSGTW